MRHFRPVLSHAECADTLRHLADLVEPYLVRIANVASHADQEPQAIIERNVDIDRMLDLPARIRFAANELEAADIAALEIEIDF